MAVYVLKRLVYRKGILSGRKDIGEYGSLTEARMAAYHRVRNTDDNVEVCKRTAAGDTDECLIYFRDFGNSYPYGRWTFCIKGDSIEMLNPDGTLDRRSERTIARERKPSRRFY